MIAARMQFRPSIRPECPFATPVGCREQVDYPFDLVHPIVETEPNSIERHGLALYFCKSVNSWTPRLRRGPNQQFGEIILL
jgi:hypothetical protein